MIRKLAAEAAVVRSVSAAEWTDAAPCLGTLRAAESAEVPVLFNDGTHDLRFETGTFGRLPSFPDALSPKGTASGPSSSPPKILRAGAFLLAAKSILWRARSGRPKRPHFETGPLPTVGTQPRWYCC